jgi:uncharacterized membrane protein
MTPGPGTSLLLADIISALQHFVTATLLHPVLVHFTAALVPVSIASDLAGRLADREPLRQTGWWTLAFATAITPFTAAAGWLFWMPDDNGVAGMAVHKWLGTGLAAALLGFCYWRSRRRGNPRGPGAAYFVAGALLIVALSVQGWLGGRQVYGS